MPSENGLETINIPRFITMSDSMNISMSFKDPESHQQANDEQVMLEKLGYKQELKRSHTIVSLAAFGVVMLTPPTAIMNTLTTPLVSGGSQALVWGYIIVSIFTFIVALSMAEIAAVYPVSGGPLSWAYQLGKSKNIKILSSWYTGYFNIFAQISFAASASFQGVVQILSAVSLAHPDYTSQRYHFVLVTIGFIILFTCTNIFLNKYYSQSTKALFIYNISSVLAVMVTLLATAPARRDAKFIFTDYSNLTGFSSHGYVFILGLLQSAYTFTGYDSVTHLAEEAETGTNIIPKALMIVITTAILYGFMFVMVICSVIYDIPALVDSSTGSAFTQLVYNNTGSIAGTVVIILLPALGALFAAEAMTLSNSRTIYSFARDGAFIFPKYFSKVSDRWGVPIPALVFSCVVQSIIIILYLTSDVVFNTILALTTIGHELAYMSPIALMLFGGRSRMPADRPWNLGMVGVAINAISIAWLSFVSITMIFPTVYPVTAGNMNYTIIIMFLVITYATVCWFVQGKRTYKGPTEVLDEEFIELDAVDDQADHDKFADMSYMGSNSDLKPSVSKIERRL